MTRIFDYRISWDEQALTIEHFLKKQGYSHAIFVHLKKTPNSILRNGEWDYLRTPLRAGDTLQVVLTEPQTSLDISPVALPLSIVYEDADILIVNKSAHMPVHPSRRHTDDTLANAVMHHWKEAKTPYAFRCVNRLDADTTGLVLLAKHMLSSAILNEEVRTRRIIRTYLALVHGLPPAEGTVCAPIMRKEAGGVERIVDEVQGAHAVTHYKRLSYNTVHNCSLLSLRLETGRTHQIRVHMKHIGHPLLGDARYGSHTTAPSLPTSEKTADFGSSCGVKTAVGRLHEPPFSQIKRQALHSCSLQFTHPITGKAMDFFAPLPADMASLIAGASDCYTQSLPAEALF